MMTIGSIIGAAGNTSVRAIRHQKAGEGAPFVSKVLNDAYSEGDILIVEGLSGAIQEIHVTVTWTFADEAKNPSTNAKVALAKTLLENGIDALDSLLVKSLRGRSVLNILRDYCYFIGPISTVLGQPAYYFLLSTAFTWTPRRG